MADIIQVRRGTALEATTANVVLADGEMGYEKDTHKFKFGDGVTHWNSLPYSTATQEQADYTESNSALPSFIKNKPNLTSLHTHSNKTTLDAIQEALTTALKSGYDGAVTWITTNGSTLLGLVGFPGFGTSHTTAAYGDHTHSIPTALSDLSEDITHRTVTDTEKSTWNSKQAAGNYELNTNKDVTGGYAGLTLFKLNLRNAADTFTSFLTNTATAVRTWTMPNKDGTVAMTDDITDALITITDVTTNNVSTSKHGFFPKLPTSTGKYLKDDMTWDTPAGGGGSSLWILMTNTPTRSSNTVFYTAGDLTSYIVKGIIIKWTESSNVKCAMISIPSTYSSGFTYMTIIGDTMNSIDASSLKYCMLGAELINFTVAGNISAILTDVANAYYAKEPKRVIGAEISVGTAGTTNSTTIDINKAGSTMFTVKPTLASTVAACPLAFTANDAISLALNEKVTIDIDAVQTTNAIDLYIQLYLFPTRLLNLT